MGRFSTRRIAVILVISFLLVGLGYLGFFKPDTNDAQTASQIVDKALGSTPTVALDLLTADFDEPFIPTVKGANPEPLATALEKYKKDERRKSRKVDILEEFLERNPDDPWAPSVQVNLGIYYQSVGRFSGSLRHLKQAWESLSSSDETRIRALADRALGQYAQTLAHLGRVEDLSPLLEETKDRSVSGHATELLANSREALYIMNSSPEYSFWCGPSALKRIGERRADWTEDSFQALKRCESTQKGTSLLQNRDLSREVSLNLQMAYRESGSPLVTPAVVHWKAGHFAALFATEQEGIYSVEDDTASARYEELLLDSQSLDEEASGYFLIPSGPLPEGWRSVSEDEGKNVWGRGNTGDRKDADATGGDDEICPPGPCPPQSGDSEGMAVWSAHTMLVSLRIQDTPVGLSPAAFSVPFTVTYAQREANQPAVFDYSNLGPKWTTNWTSFITDNRTTGNQASVYKIGGGAEPYAFQSGNPKSQQNAYNQSYLTDTGDGFRLDRKSGAYQEYKQLIGSRYHLTSIVDPQGNTTSLEYDELGRLSTIRDAVGRAMTMSYDLPTDPLKITQVTDPFGRSATFNYLPDGHLGSITDTIGLVSSFQYGLNDFINTMTTPYGTTAFTYGDISTDPTLRNRRFLEITDPEGRKHRVESGVYGSFSVSDTPTGMPHGNTYMQYRNSFYWEPQQLDSTPDYAKSTVYHFLHTSNSTGRVLESMKKPLENRVFYAYTANRSPIFFTGKRLPSHIGRLLADGRSQITKYLYNSVGHVTQTTDPAGRIFNYSYAPNEIDLTGVSTGGQSLFSATYDGSHNITSLTDASGGTSTFTYNSRGQVTSMTNPLQETTNYTYTVTGNLYTIEAPMQKVTTFLYDDAERVSTVVDSEGYSAAVSYDALDRPVSLTYPDGTTDTITYNRLDVIATKDRLGRQTQMSYDNLGRVKSVLDANGGTTSFGYGLVDSPTSLTDPKGNTTTFQFDLQARLQAKKYADGAQQTIAYQGCCGQVASVTDAAGNTKTYSYEIDNQLKQIDYSGSTPDVTFTNDTFLPRPLSMTDGQGTTSITYGPIGAPGANQVSSISGPFGDTATFSYDIAGRPVGSVVNGSVSSVTYDALWRPTSITNELDTFQMDYLGKTGQVTSVSSAFGPTMQYSYAANIGDRRLLQIKNLRNNGSALSQFDYTYDAVGQITKLTATYGEGGGDTDDGDGDDEDDDCTCKGHGKKVGHHKGKGKGHHTHGNGQGNGHDSDCAKNKKSKDKKKHKDNKKKSKHGKDKKKDKAHKHDKNDKHVSLLELLIKMVFEFIWGWDVGDWGDGHDDDCEEPGGGGGEEPSGNTETWEFQYDNLSQLVGVNLNDTPYASYEIDDAGNLTSVTIEGITTTLGHNSLNQVTSPGTPGYDPKGQTTTDAEGRVFEWDEQGRVTAIITGNKRSVFGYDGMSRRTVITEYEDEVMVSKKLYWWLGGSIVTERDGLGTDYPVTKRYYGQGVVDNGTKLYYTTDHLGSVRELLDESGNVVAEYRYSIYGERTKVSGDLDSDWGYAGLFHHEPSGLDLATYRLYDPKQRRFISRDPLGEAVDYNLYRYANNNPINYRDPVGLAAETPWDAFNVGLGITSFGINFYSGNIWGAAEDALGLALDIGATLVPGIPGGASSFIQAKRAAKGAKKIASACKKKKKLSGHQRLQKEIAEEFGENTGRRRTRRELQSPSSNIQNAIDANKNQNMVRKNPNLDSDATMRSTSARDNISDYHLKPPKGSAEELMEYYSNLDDPF